jgi:hypothetical protein
VGAVETSPIAGDHDCDNFDTHRPQLFLGCQSFAPCSNLSPQWRQAIGDTIKSAPNTLFVTAAGNSDSDASFLQDIPASLEFPNLITVGATNQAGDATTFTSYGKTVIVYADGFHVESYIPGEK